MKINNTALILAMCTAALASVSHASEFDCNSRTEIACKLEAVKTAEKNNLVEYRTAILTSKEADKSCFIKQQYLLGKMHTKLAMLKAKGAVLCSTGVVRDIEDTNLCDGKFVVAVSDCSEGK